MAAILNAGMFTINRIIIDGFYLLLKGRHLIELENIVTKAVIGISI